MSAASFDCYLCGTTNPADAEFCQSCSGQLLKLPEGSEPDTGDDTDFGEGAGAEFAKTLTDDSGLDFADQFGDTQPSSQSDPSPNGDNKSLDENAGAPPKKKRRLSRSVNTSINDMRLSDALGLEEDIDDRLDIEVTSIPTVRSAENIPIIGTRTATTIRSTSDEGIGKIAYVIVAMLFAATAWFGYDTLVRAPERLSPDSIGFVEPTGNDTEATTTTAAAAPISLELDLNDIDSMFRSTIVRVVPYVCDGNTGDPIDAQVGIAIDEHTVLLGPNVPAEANAIRIVTRTGAQRNGLIGSVDAMTLTTSLNRTTRHLSITETASEADFYVGYDFASNSVTTSTAPQGLDAEIAVSKFGHVFEVRIADQTTPADALVDIDLAVQPIEDGRPTNSPNVCQDRNQLEFVEAPTGEATAGENEVDADQETVDAN